MQTVSGELVDAEILEHTTHDVWTTNEFHRLAQERLLDVRLRE